MGLMSGGAIGGAYMGQRSARNANKAQKQRMKMLQEGLNQFKAGSLDAFGNKLSAGKDGVWKYDLSLPTKLQKVAAEDAMRRTASYRNQSPIDLLSKSRFGMDRALNESASASQGAAMKNALRSGSNVGAIATAFNNQKMKNLQNSLLNSYKMGQNFNQVNANNINALGSNVNTLQQPINNMQSNLQGMVKGLNGQVMNQYNTMASAIQPKQDRLTAAMKGADEGFRGSLKDINSLIKTGKNAFKLYSMMNGAG